MDHARHSLGRNGAPKPARFALDQHANYDRWSTGDVETWLEFVEPASTGSNTLSL